MDSNQLNNSVSVSSVEHNRHYVEADLPTKDNLDPLFDPDCIAKFNSWSEKYFEFYQHFHEFALKFYGNER